MIKVVTVIGARPQFIKAAPVSKALKASGRIRERIIHTGQHFDSNMSSIFFEQMDIPRPDFSLDIHSLPHGAMTGRMLEATEKILSEERPDWVLVYGDTNSTLAGALAASKLMIPVAHVESGLRSFNMDMPEEINRCLTDRISRLLFCPTPVAVNNLKNEGFIGNGTRIILCGDVMYDASIMFRGRAKKPDSVPLPEKYVLATVHRAENTDDTTRLKNIVEGLNLVSEKLPLVFPVHPRTRKLLNKPGIPPLSEKVILTSPVGYLEMLYLLDNCMMLLTDSGGMQKEACFFEKACITLRNETEWTELLDAGYNKLAGSDPALIVSSFEHFLKHPPRFGKNLYGNGRAADEIVKALLI